MKKILSLLAMLVAVQFSYAQFTTSGTNTTTTNNVGIGTTSPESGFNIDVNGLGAIGTQASARLYMGTTDATHAFIQSRDNSINQNLTFDAASYNFAIGNVGIGTTTPGALLNISSAGAVGNSTAIRFDNTFNTANNRNWAMGLNVFAYGDFCINQSNSQNGDPITAGISRFYISQSGNVGIGTGSPLNKLDVQGGNASVYNTGAATGFAIGSGATGKTVLSLSTSADANGYGVISSVSASGSTYGNTVINPNGGNVGIGTTDPQGHKLAVNGDIIATKITVLPHANWPDYVFKPTYNLPSLSEVKSYIDQNQHLPDMPSEQEVAKEGVDLGEIVKVQTKKIEELTLYIIEQQKQLDQLKETVKDLSQSANK